MAVVQTLIGNVKGPQGDTGATGPQGAQGEAATINVGTVSTTAYGNAAQVTNVGTESDAVLNFVIPQGKPGERTTTMGGLTLDTITTQTADYPVPAVGDTGAIVFGKIVKWFSDALTAIAGKLDKSHVTDSLTVTQDGYALDAKAGKALKDEIDKNGSFVLFLNANSTGTKSASQSADTISKYTYILMCAVFNDQIMASTIFPRIIIANNTNRRQFWLSFTASGGTTIRRCGITFNNADLTSVNISALENLTNVFIYAVR